MDGRAGKRPGKKLTAAARWILGARPDVDALKQDLAAFGLALQADTLPPSYLDVWPENWPAVQVFEAMQTQWRFNPMGGISGLEYASLPVVIRLLGFNARSYHEIFPAIRIMEMEAMNLIAK